MECICERRARKGRDWRGSFKPNPGRRLFRALQALEVFNTRLAGGSDPSFKEADKHVWEQYILILPPNENLKGKWKMRGLGILPLDVDELQPRPKLQFDDYEYGEVCVI